MSKVIDIDLLCGNYFDKWDLIDLPIVSSCHIFTGNEESIFGSYFKRMFGLSDRLLSIDDNGLFSPQIFRTIDYRLSSFAEEDSKHDQYIMDIYNSEIENENVFLGQCAKMVLQYPYVKQEGVELLRYIFGTRKQNIKDIINGKEYLMIDSDCCDWKKAEVIGLQKYSEVLERKSCYGTYKNVTLIDYRNCCDFFIKVLDSINLNDLYEKIKGLDDWNKKILMNIVEKLIKNSKKPSCFITNEIIVIPPKFRPLIYSFTDKDLSSALNDNSKKVYLFMDKLNYAYRELFMANEKLKHVKDAPFLVAKFDRERMFNAVDELFKIINNYKYGVA